MITGISDFNFISAQNHTPATLSIQADLTVASFRWHWARIGRCTHLSGLFSGSNLPSAARLTLLYICRLRSPAAEHASAPGGFLMPGDAKFEARVAPLVLAHLLPSFDSQILTSMPHKRQFFGPFLGFDWGSFASKTSSFSAFQNAKSFGCTRSVGSFRKNNIFLPFPCLFPPCRVPFAYPCRRRLPALSCDNSNRLPQVGGRVKSKVRASGVGRQGLTGRGRALGGQGWF